MNAAAAAAAAKSHGASHGGSHGAHKKVHHNVSNPYGAKRHSAYGGDHKKHSAHSAHHDVPGDDKTHSADHPATLSKSATANDIDNHLAQLMQDLEDEENAMDTYDRFSDQPKFLIIIGIAISVNAVQMGFELELQGDAWKIVWTVLENIFTLFFLVEMLIKFKYDGVKDYFSMKANILDCIIVMTAVVDNWMLGIFMTQEEKDQYSFLSALKLVRLARILKLLKMKRELKLLVESIVSSLSSMVWLSVLLAILIYAVAICCVQFVGSSDLYPKKEFDNKKYFGNMRAAAVTGLNLAMLDGFGDLLRAMLRYQPLYALGISLYVGIASFGIMNAIIGVIVTKTSEAAAECEQEDTAAYRKRQMACVASISNIIYSIDTDGDGTVSPEEIKMAENNEELKEVLEAIDLPYAFHLSDLHCMLDKDGDGELDKVEFFTGMHRLVFSNDFHRQCLMSLAIAQQKRKLFELKLEMEDSFKEVNAKLDILVGRRAAPPAASIINEVQIAAPRATTVKTAATAGKTKQQSHMKTAPLPPGAVPSPAAPPADDAVPMPMSGEWMPLNQPMQLAIQVRPDDNSYDPQSNSYNGQQLALNDNSGFHPAMNYDFVKGSPSHDSDNLNLGRRIDPHRPQLPAFTPGMWESDEVLERDVAVCRQVELPEQPHLF